jgi:hypothetical protein
MVLGMPACLHWTNGRQFQTRFKEHALAYKNNYSNSAYTQHLINNGQSLGHMEDVMDIIFSAHKGKHLDAGEKYHIYQKTEKGMQINGRSTFANNKIFDIIVKQSTTDDIPPTTPCR